MALIPCKAWDWMQERRPEHIERASEPIDRCEADSRQRVCIARETVMHRTPHKEALPRAQMDIDELCTAMSFPRARDGGRRAHPLSSRKRRASR
jgi:hypothetical protein